VDTEDCDKGPTVSKDISKRSGVSSTLLSKRRAIYERNEFEITYRSLVKSGNVLSEGASVMGGGCVHIGDGRVVYTKCVRYTGTEGEGEGRE